MKDKFERIFAPEELRNAIVPRGVWWPTVGHPDGSQTEYGPSTNVVTWKGKDWLISFLVSANAAASTFTMNYVAAGTGSTPETVNDTALVTEVKRVVATVTHAATGVIQFVASFGTGSAAGAITEFGIFNSSSAGTMLARDTESVVNVGSSDTLTVTAQITLS